MSRKVSSKEQPQLSYDTETVAINGMYLEPSHKGYSCQDERLGHVVYKAGFVPAQNEPLYQQQLRNSNIQTARHIRGSPALSLYSSTESYRSTPSPDFTLGSCQTSSPLFVRFQQHALPKVVVSTDTVPPLNYFHAIANVKATVKTEQSCNDHDYTFSPVSSSITSETRSASLTPELEPIVNERASSDSGNSTIPDDINPLCMNDWYRDLLKAEFSERLKEEMDLILHRSDLRKEQFLTVKMSELPSGLEYNPNKSRLRKIYENPTEAADRERNNLASRRSRFKKKIAQQITNMHLEFDRDENAQLYAIQNWIGKIVFELESKWLDNGATSDELYELRHYCGFPQNQSDRGYVSAQY